MAWARLRSWRVAATSRSRMATFEAARTDRLARLIRALSRAPLVLAAAALIVWRAPRYLVAPSFWAEDGLLFFARASNGGVLQERPAGYLSLYTNLATTRGVARRRGRHRARVRAARDGRGGARRAARADRARRVRTAARMGRDAPARGR